MKHTQSILELHFSHPTKFNTEEFFHSFRKWYHAFQGLLKIDIIYQEYDLKRVPYKRELIDL